MRYDPGLVALSRLLADELNQKFSLPVDCRLHCKIAHQSTLEWTLAMSALQLPPYVVEHIFNSLKVQSQHDDYQQRVGVAFLWICQNSPKINENFVHLIVEERSHHENIKMFISAHKMYQSKEDRKE